MLYFNLFYYLSIWGRGDAKPNVSGDQKPSDRAARDPRLVTVTPARGASFVLSVIGRVVAFFILMLNVSRAYRGPAGARI